MHIEHIDPYGGNVLENLCLACSSCNLSKGNATSGTDPLTDNRINLFNPRLDEWVEHFEWVEGGLLVSGKSPVGRATVERLKMNQPRIVRARQNWVIAGTHPPAK